MSRCLLFQGYTQNTPVFFSALLSNHWYSGYCCFVEVPLKGHLRSSQVTFFVIGNLCCASVIGNGEDRETTSAPFCLPCRDASTEMRRNIPVSSCDRDLRSIYSHTYASNRPDKINMMLSKLFHFHDQIRRHFKSCIFVKINDFECHEIRWKR